MKSRLPVVPAPALRVFPLSNTLITSNSTGLSSADGGQILSFGNNSVEGNGTNGVPTSAVTPQI
jgi:hypothetical protein